MPRKVNLTLDDVVHAAVQIVDADGVDAVTMRRLGETLGINPMTVYRVIPTKEDLLDELAAALVDDAEIPSLASDDWEADLRTYLLGLMRIVELHPNAASLLNSVAGLAAMGRAGIPTALSIVRAGYPAPVAQAAVSAVLGYVATSVALAGGGSGPVAGALSQLSQVLAFWEVAVDAPPEAQQALGFTIRDDAVEVNLVRTPPPSPPVAEPVDREALLDLVAAGVRSSDAAAS